MNSRFIKTEDVSYERCNIEKYSKIDIDKFYSTALPKIARGVSENWKHFEKRRYKAEDALDKFIFGRFFNKTFSFVRIPDEYTDYQYSKHSEFGVSARNLIGGMSISIDINEIFNFATGKCDDPHKMLACETLKPSNIYSIDKINSNRIGYAFNHWELCHFLLNNTANYVKNNCDQSGCISVSRWITATGKSGRTKEIESLQESCALSWEIKHNSFSTEISVISPNDAIIGEINWKTDEEHPEDTEFNEVYVPLLNNGQADIQSIKLQTIIPHNTPKGRPRKALAQVLITLHINNIEKDENYIARTKQDIQSMRTLAAIDYNRKCDILEGKIPEMIPSLEEFFSDDEFPTDNPFVTYDILQSRDFLSGSSFTIDELEEIWNIYMPILTFCSLRDKNSPYFKNENTRLFYKRHFYNYVLECEHDVRIFKDQTYPVTHLKLSLFKNQ